MNYNFKLNSGDKIRVFINKFIRDEEKNEYGVASWNASSDKFNYKEHYSYIHKDKQGREFFRYYDEIVYLDSYLAMSPKELVDEIGSNNAINPNEFVYTLMRYGLDCVKLYVAKKPMDKFNFGLMAITFDTESNCDDKSKWAMVEYKLEETEMFKLHDNFKIRLTPANDKDKEKYSTRTYYISDLVSLLSACKDKYRVKVA